MKHAAIKQGVPTVADSADGVLSAIEAGFAVIKFDLSGTILSVNSKALLLLGYDQVDLIGQHHRILCPPELARDSEYQDFWEQLAQGKPQQGEFPRLCKSGREVWLQASYIPVCDITDCP